MENLKNTQSVQIPAYPESGFSVKRGKTTFIVGLFRSESSKETLESKVKKLIRNDVKTSNF